MMAAPAHALGADGPASTIEAGFGMCAGNLSYGLELTGYDTRLGQRITVQSDLEWPLATTVAQGVWRLSWPAGPRRHYGARLSLWSSLDDPRGVLKDSDWGAPADAPRRNSRFSYLESDVSGRMFIADLGLWLAFDRDPRGHDGVALLAGYRHEHASLVASNIRGRKWLEPRWMPVNEGGDLRAIELRSQLILPYVGARWQRTVASGVLSSSIEMRFGPGYVHVRDDHTLRHKLFEASAVGWALSVRSEPRLHFAGWWSAGLDLEWQLVRADWGRLDEHFYADDLSIAGDQTGQSIHDVPFYAQSLRYAALLVVGLEMR